MNWISVAMEVALTNVSVYWKHLMILHPSIMFVDLFGRNICQTPA